MSCEEAGGLLVSGSADYCYLFYADFIEKEKLAEYKRNAVGICHM